MLLRQIKWYLQFLGSLENPYSIGTNKLIKNGAYLTTDIFDILEKYPKFLNKKRRNISIKKNKIKIKKEYKDIYESLSNEFQVLDKIVIKSRKNLRETINILTLMEIDGLVEFKIGMGYRKKEA